MALALFTYKLPSLLRSPVSPHPGYVPSNLRSSSIHFPMPGYSVSHAGWAAFVMPNTFMKGTLSTSFPVSVLTKRPFVFIWRRFLLKSILSYNIKFLEKQTHNIEKLS